MIFVLFIISLFFLQELESNVDKYISHKPIVAMMNTILDFVFLIVWWSAINE